MQQDRNAAPWLLSFLKAGGLATLFLLPCTLAATLSSEQSVSTPLSDPDTYDPAVKQLLDTTYLGHANNLPDPGEPAEVLQKYLEQNAHGYQDHLTTQEQKLDDGLVAWQDLVQRYPDSRHAFVALAKHYKAKAIASGDLAYTRQAADAYIRATEIGLENGRIRYTRELSELLGVLGDRKGLDEIFERILALPSDIDHDHYYLALVDYADGLARFSDDRAWGYFEQAMDLHPENNLEAINRYAKSLLDRGQPQKAFAVLETRLTSAQRVRSVLPAQLRKQAMEQIGLDTTSADAEIALTSQRLKGAWAAALPGDSTGEPSDTVTTVTAALEKTDAETAVMAASVHDPRVSTIFAVRTNNNKIAEDAIFIPNGAMNNRWPNMKPQTATALKIATIKWPDGRAVLFRIGTDNAVYYRYYNGSSWLSWQALASGSAIDISAVVWPNGQADVFGVDGDQCNVYVSHSTNGQSWGAWTWWGSCGDQIAVAVMPDGTAWAMLRTLYLFNQYVAVKRYFNGSTWDNFWVYFPDPQLSVTDIDLLAYAPPVCCAKLTLWAVGSDNSSVYYRNWTGSTWSAWTLWTTGYKRVSSFSTSDGGAYLLLLGINNNNLYTERFTGTAWAGITPQGMTTWLAAAGINIDDETGNAYEHTEATDDCRVQPYTNGPVCDNFGNCFWTQGVNLAEVIYNEAQGETPGAQDTVGWTVRNRAFQGLSCDIYPGGVNWHTSCSPQPCQPCSTLPCNQGSPDFCTNNNTRWYCCAIHGGQTLWGTSGYQFNDEHVDINTLSSSGVIWEAVYVGNGWVGDVSTYWCPPGVIGCSFACSRPWSTSGSNYNDPSPNGPMEFQNVVYMPAASSCKQAPTVNTCQGAANNFVCCNASPNNYF